jgi:hypothetical protein
MDRAIMADFLLTICLTKWLGQRGGRPGGRRSHSARDVIDGLAIACSPSGKRFMMQNVGAAS